MNLTAESIDSLTLLIAEEIHVKASLETTFAAILEEIGPQSRTPEGQSMNMKIEPWPGGRWYRDLGNDNGHLWAHVQAIKRPTLLEFTGPLFMSNAVISNIQYRLSESDGGTLIKFRHQAFGLMEDAYRSGVKGGWAHTHAAVRARAEAHS
jgi:hypothetical protein